MFASIVTQFNALLFFLSLALFLLLFDLYAWQALKTMAKSWNIKTQKTLFVSYWSITTLFITLLVLRPFIQLEKFNSSFLMLLQVFGVILFISKIFVIVPLFIEDLVRGVTWVVNKFSNSDSEPVSMHPRRGFLSKTGLLMGALPFLSMTWGLVKGAHNYRIRRVRIKSHRIPKSFDGFKIIQLSDIHSGSFWDKSAVERGIRMINECKADLVLFTGDLVNNTATELEPWVQTFKQIKAQYGVYSVLGNHDYGDYVAWNSVDDKKANMQQLMELQKQMGWTVLNNKNVSIEKEQDRIRLIGVENWSAKSNFPKYGRLSEAVIGVDPNEFKILMSHDPSHWRAEVLKHEADIDLTLSGHTHGFQFGIETHGLKWSPVKYVYPEWAGLYTVNQKKLYVNRGFGYIGYPGRLGILPEITEITLESDS